VKTTTKKKARSASPRSRLGSWRSWRSWTLGALVAVSAGCSDGHSAPAQPTWADVAPILHGECAQCHGSTALATGFGYRLDFYDMTSAVCGDAALALQGPAPILAHAAAASILTDVTPPAGGGFPLMPPQPAPALADWERETLERWAAQPDKGPPPKGNRPPVIQVNGLPPVAQDELAFTALLSDPDDDEVVGVIEIADRVFAMNRSGTFRVALDVSTLAAGPYRMTAVLCDGWSSASYDLGPLQLSR
jgi:hypothetical protein